MAGTVRVYDVRTGLPVDVSPTQAATAYQAGAAGWAQGARVPVQTPDGRIGTVAPSDVGALLESGGQLVAEDAYAQHVEQRQAERQRAADIEKYDSATGAFLAGAARTATFGLSDVALAGLAGEEMRKRLEVQQEASPIASGLGELGGMGVGLLTGSTEATAGKAALGAAERVAVGAAEKTALQQAATVAAAPLTATEIIGKAASKKVAEAFGEKAAASMLGRTVASSAQAGTEGALFGMGQAVSEAAIHDDYEHLGELALQHAASGALFGAGLGAAFGAAGAGIDATLTKRAEALRDAAAEQAWRVSGSYVNYAKMAEDSAQKEARKLGIAYKPGDGIKAVGREALDRGLIRAGDTAETFAPRVEAERERLGQAIGAAREQAEAEGAQVAKVHEVTGDLKKLRNQYVEQGEFTNREAISWLNGIVREIENKSGLTEKLSDIQAAKLAANDARKSARDFAAKANAAQKEAHEAGLEAQRLTAKPAPIGDLKRAREIGDELTTWSGEEAAARIRLEQAAKAAEFIKAQRLQAEELYQEALTKRAAKKFHDSRVEQLVGLQRAEKEAMSALSRETEIYAPLAAKQDKLRAELDALHVGRSQKAEQAAQDALAKSDAIRIEAAQRLQTAAQAEAKVQTAIDAYKNASMPMAKWYDYRIQLDKTVRHLKPQPGMPEPIRAEATRAARAAIEGRIDQGMEAHLTGDSYKAYRDNMRAYGKIAILDDALERTVFGKLSNRQISLTDTIAGAGGVAVGAVLGGLSGGIAGAGLGLANKYWKAHGPSTQAILLDRMAKTGAYLKAAEQQGQRLESAVGRFLSKSAAGPAKTLQLVADKMRTHESEQKRFERVRGQLVKLEKAGPQGAAMALGGAAHGEVGQVAAAKAQAAVRLLRDAAGATPAQAGFSPRPIAVDPFTQHRTLLRADLIAGGPVRAARDLEAGRYTMEHTKILKELYPKGFAKLQEAAARHLASSKAKLSPMQREQLQRLFELPADSARSDPALIAQVQGAMIRGDKQAQAQQTKPAAMVGTNTMKPASQRLAEGS